MEVAGGYLGAEQGGEVVLLSDFAGCPPQVLRDRWRQPADLRLYAVGTDQSDAR
jgi:hypothetical protein